MREALSRQYDLGSREPNIQVWNVNLRGDRSLTLRHTQHNDRPLHDSAQEVLKHVARLWGFGVHLESVNAAGDVSKRWTVPAPRELSVVAPAGRFTGEDLPRVHDVLRVERALERAHHLDRAGAGLVDQEAHLVQPDAVLAGAGAFQRDRALHQLRRSAARRSRARAASAGSTR